MIDRSHPSGLPAERPPIDRSHPSGLPAGRIGIEVKPLQGQADAADDIDAELDAEELRGDNVMRGLGMSEQEIAKLRGRSVDRLAKAPPPKPTLAGVERELAELKELRRSDHRAYWSDETQKREAELTAARERLKAGDASAEQDGEPDASDDGSMDSIAGVLPDTLKEEWEASPGGIEEAIAAIKLRTSIITETLDDADEEALKTGFDDLPEDAKTAIASSLAIDSGRWPKASEEDIGHLRETDHGPALLESWGASAHVRLGAAKKEADYMLSRMSEMARLKTHHWVESQSPAGKRAIINVLAQRAARRSLVRASGRRG